MSLSSFINKSIKTRVIVLVTSLLIFGMLSITFLATLIAYSSMSEQTNALLDTKSHFVEQKMEQRLHCLIENTEILTQNELVVNALTDADGREKYLPQLVQNFLLAKDIVSLDIVDFDGAPIFQTQEKIPNFNESKNLRSALAMGNLDYYIDIADHNFVVVSPIKYYGTVQGAAIVVFNLENILHHSFVDAQQMYVTLFKESKKIYSYNYEEERNYQVNYRKADNGATLFSKLYLSLELGMDSEVYLAPIKKVIFTLLLFGVVFISFGVFLARYLALSITNPVLELHRRVTAKNATGTLFCSPLDTSDELEELAKAFDKRTMLLQYQAEHDALTSLPNRVLFLDRVRENIKMASSNSSLFAIFFIDLDHFKEMNDSFGHDFGDEFLLVVANELSGVTKESDSIARMGGDEFALLLNNLRNIHEIVPVIEKIMQIFKKPFKLQGHDFYATCSIGISIYPTHGTSPEVLLKNADAAMYKAKDEGRNNYKFYTDDLTQKAYERIVLEKELRNALINREFEVYYQPQVDMRDSSIIGMEALIRWRHPQKGLVSPANFIPLAEETGLIVEIDRVMTSTAMHQFQKWIENGYSVGVLSMNLSMVQLDEHDFLKFVKETLASSKLATKNIAFEVTETQVMRNPQNAIALLQKLKDLGIKLAVDDFGTGHSSLSYLKQLPIDKLKIDQSFTCDVLIDENDAELTRAIISIAKSLRLNVIAEGVETRDQVGFLLENGCYEAQGYFYYKPQSAEDITKILAKGLS